MPYWINIWHYIDMRTTETVFSYVLLLCRLCLFVAPAPLFCLCLCFVLFFFSVVYHVPCVKEVANKAVNQQPALVFEPDHHSWYYNEWPRRAGFRSVNPAERWRENPARALARAGFSQHLECGIHRFESSPEESFALIPHPVARWAKTTS